MALHLGAARAPRLPFRVYALDTLLTGLEAPTKAQLAAAMQGHILATGQIVGTYGRAQLH